MLRAITLTGFVALAVAVLGCGPSSDNETERVVSDFAVEAAEPTTQELERAGDLAVRNRLTAKAVSFYETAIKTAQSPSKQLLDKLGQQYVNAGRVFDSVELTKRAIKRYPNDAELRQKLVGLQAALGMQYDAAEHLKWLVQHGHGNVNLLIILSDLNRPQTVESTCKYALDTYPDDRRPLFSLAMLPAYHSRWDEVAEKLKPVVKHHPDFAAAHALYGRALVELGDQSKVEQWSRSVPENIESQPQYWLAAGVWSQQHGRKRAAAKAFWKAAMLDQNNTEALTRLSASLARMDQIQQAEKAARRAESLAILRDQVDSLLSWRQNSQKTAVKIARTLSSLGRRWEATTWLHSAFKMTQHPDPDLPAVYQSIRQQLTAATPWQNPDLLVASQLDFSALPSIDWNRELDPNTSPSLAWEGTKIVFQDQASLRQLDHTCKLDKPPGEEAGLRFYQSGAGGAGVIDFDHDGNPDCYLTAMDGQPMQFDSSPNRLYRNVDGQFRDVTLTAGVGDTGFAQGIAVGDYNSDGMPDLYVGNIGRNALYRNNGDGTFTDVSNTVGVQHEEWTTSVAIADINDDGLADFYDVGYCAGDKPYTQLCIEPDLQEPRSCSPNAFDAQPDRVLRGGVDGTLTDVTDSWIGPHEPGRGFGIVVGQLDGNPGLDAFVANDMTANHLWCGAIESGKFRLLEQGPLRGLAFNGRSVSQASMGIAAGDPDQDGDIDFLVTHFFGEHNTYYEQVGDALWADNSHRVGLAEPSDPMLAYGTQWIDANNDGSSELFIANGDIDDFTHRDRMFRQPPQLFRREGDGRYRDAAGPAVGDYFETKRLARSVAKLDADRDGHTDLVVTHLFDPVALLINQTPTNNKQIRFYLVATSTHRDAIGSKVNVTVGDDDHTAQLLAGDGFQCSNERCLTFGLQNANRVDAVTVQWPSGTVQEFGAVENGGVYLLIEGAADVTRYDH